MNKWNGIGRLVRDPELRYSQSGVGICTFTLAIDRRFKNSQGERETDFIQIKTFKALAELCANHLTKGKLAGVSGALQISSYEKDGQKRYSTDIIADEVQFLSPKDSDVQAQSPTSSFGHEVSLDDDIPF
jgi:single stranded DNA-binding protein (ssb)